MIAIENSLNKISKNSDYYDLLESLSVKLQRRVSSIVKLLDFNKGTSDALIINAIEYFKLVNGKIDNDAPIDFLEQEEIDVLFIDKKIRASLYKALLFIHIEDRLKSGNLNLKYSYNYKAFDESLIDKDTWGANRDELIVNAGLGDFKDFKALIKILKQELNTQYDLTNKNILSGKNKYVIIDDDNKVKVKTPSASNDDNEYISSLLSNTGFMPILQILSNINNITNFTDSFKHHSNKFKKMKPSHEVIFAGILAKGCNIGISKIANISVGISERVLRNVVNWCFDLKNIQAANNMILATINKLSLANAFKDVKLKQSVEKQLNKVELSNKFSRAVFFDRNQEFQYGEKHDQEINAACMSLIQNAIVLWNYLYLSQILVDNNDQEQKEQMLRSIKSGSAITWHHVNLHGEYDFTKDKANDTTFEMTKILKLDVK